MTAHFSTRPAPRQPISLEESKRLIVLEAIITRGKLTFVEVGNALTEIRDRRLYKSSHATFEDYCRVKWGWTRMRSHQLIEAAAVVRTLPENVNHGLQNERQARALSKVEPEKRAAVLKAAGPKPTAEGIRMAALATRAAGRLDGTGYPIPPEIVEDWERAEEIQAHLTGVSTLRGILRRAEETRDKAFAEVSFQEAYAGLDKVYTELKQVRPYAVCPTCQGLVRDTCTQCKGRGYVSEFYWSRCIPEETRKFRAKAAPHG